MINQSSFGGHHHLHQATSALLNQAGFPNNAHAAPAGLVRTLLPGGHPNVSLGLEVRKTHITQNCHVINWGIQTFGSPPEKRPVTFLANSTYNRERTKEIYPKKEVPTGKYTT